MFTLPDLPYGYDALEPAIDARTMELHHGKHHATYVEKVNDALKDHHDFSRLDITVLLQRLDDLPEDIRSTVQNNGGGHLNHSLFWTNMTPAGSKLADGALNRSLSETFGTLDEFKKAFSSVAATVFGSGWVWLTLDNGKLAIQATGRQDNPIMQGKTPLLGLDLWEHAFYLQYQNRRPEYVTAWWDVVDWTEVQRRYDEAL